MAYTAVFIRHENKYLISQEKYNAILPVIEKQMQPDSYGAATIRNIYYDTPDYRLIRRSIEKPVYKEKLRLRSYGRGAEEVFVELKKKYRGIVYKRRIVMSEQEAIAWLKGSVSSPRHSQIVAEISYFLSYYKNLQPRLYLSYERQAYHSKVSPDLRITFDRNIRCRDYDLQIGKEPGGISILNENQVLMEVKTAGGMPLWLAQLLSQHKIYRSSFSKYGTAYQTILLPKHKGVLFHA